MNVARVPQNGRNFEYCSGEDPHLGGQVHYICQILVWEDQYAWFIKYFYDVVCDVMCLQLIGPVIRGIQSHNVIATAKHWVLNNQETHRSTYSANVDEVWYFNICRVLYLALDFILTLIITSCIKMCQFQKDAYFIANTPFYWNDSIVLFRLCPTRR